MRCWGIWRCGCWAWGSRPGGLRAGVGRRRPARCRCRCPGSVFLSRPATRPPRCRAAWPACAPSTTRPNCWKFWWATTAAPTARPPWPKRPCRVSLGRFRWFPLLKQWGGRGARPMCWPTSAGWLPPTISSSPTPTLACPLPGWPGCWPTPGRAWARSRASRRCAGRGCFISCRASTGCSR